MSQNKKWSLVEAITNTVVGFIITLLFAPIINWICNIHMTSTQIAGSVTLFTILSIARGYILRRIFNKKEQ